MTEVMLIHVSDLHFGAEYFDPPRVAPYIGLAAHETAALEALETAILDLQSELDPECTGLIVSGDVTTVGDPSEFVMAETFLRQRLRTEWRSTAGLGGIVEQAMWVPGNHDHLAGSGLLRGVLRLRPGYDMRTTYFGPSVGTDWWCRNVLSGNSIDVQLLGIDSCGARSAQFFAGGSIDTVALAELGGKIVPPTPGRPMVRVLVMHHSPSFPRAGHKLDQTSLDAYTDFCQQYAIHFTLTGHAHAHNVPRSANHNGVAVELRCGTTSQQGAAGKKHGNIFLAHLLSRSRSGDINWVTRIYQRGPQGAFAEAASLRYYTML